MEELLKKDLWSEHHHQYWYYYYIIKLNTQGYTKPAQVQGLSTLWSGIGGLPFTECGKSSLVMEVTACAWPNLSSGLFCKSQMCQLATAQLALTKQKDSGGCKIKRKSGCIALPFSASTESQQALFLVLTGCYQEIINLGIPGLEMT